MTEEPPLKENKVESMPAPDDVASDAPPPNEEAEGAAGLANPATVHCLETQGAAWSVREGPGGQYGVCSFSDGSWCEEWAYYNGYCEKGDWMTMCEKQFKIKTVCPPDYNPVCGYLNSTDTWQTFNNACKACLESEGGAQGYVVGKCR
ncbi:DUF333 domain-containing protein [Candidatus Woesearchaeota archaeon]|nr:DUF333 domain-containing protein [Candidatus Woesearchaeota archaeon]